MLPLHSNEGKANETSNKRIKFSNSSTFIIFCIILPFFQHSHTENTTSTWGSNLFDCVFTIAKNCGVKNEFFNPKIVAIIKYAWNFRAVVVLVLHYYVFFLDIDLPSIFFHFPKFNFFLLFSLPKNYSHFLFYYFNVVIVEWSSYAHTHTHNQSAAISANNGKPEKPQAQNETRARREYGSNEGMNEILFSCFLHALLLFYIFWVCCVCGTLSKLEFIFFSPALHVK